ncbi:type 2 isopentenyl-diphosphate Delta-isomerase [Sutcliffiella horikoshii]|uniref:type 2 isopentenyl-diphosphate Delta-isomerase n=1 Tax=Sutcliffiella horikoshii TaxID=79883 RepID=UPI003CF034BA
MTLNVNEVNENSIQIRKAEHINVCLERDVVGNNITNGLEEFNFQHNALPEINYNEISLETNFLSKKVKTPFLVSSMTGGTSAANQINNNLAKIAEYRGWCMGVGSMRAYIEREYLSESYKIRDIAPTIPLFANLGAVQLNYGFSVKECIKAVNLISADALVLHLNSLQEVIQPNGNTNFKNLQRKIAEICEKLEVPVGVKEVGWGISYEVAQKLMNAGVSFIDVAGAGGTSWTKVESFRAQDPYISKLSEPFNNWGIRTADCILNIKSKLPDTKIIGSGGIKDGVEGAKALVLGADLVGYGRSILKPATLSMEETDETFRLIEDQLKLSMFGVGARSIDELKKMDALFKI